MQLLHIRLGEYCVEPTIAQKQAEHTDKAYPTYRLGQVLKSAQLKRTKVDLIRHPSIQAAHEVWCSIVREQTRELIKIKTDYYLNHKTPIYLIQDPKIFKSSPKACHLFFHSFELIQVILQLPASETILIKLIARPDELTLNYYAWYEVIVLMCSCDKLSQNWPDLRDRIDEKMPADLIPIFFGDEKLTVQKFCDRVGITKKAFENQQAILKKSKKNLSLDQPKLTFNDILQDANCGDKNSKI
jgi:hypothetical protein